MLNPKNTNRFDVVSLYTSLYTSIPLQEAFTNATDSIHTPILHLAKQDKIDLQAITLNNMYFSFNSEHTITGYNMAFYRLANQIRWKHFRE